MKTAGKKKYNNRIQNEYENIGPMIGGVTKDVKEMVKMLNGMTKYGNQFHNLKKDIQNQ